MCWWNHHDVIFQPLYRLDPFEYGFERHVCFKNTTHRIRSKYLHHIQGVGISNDCTQTKHATSQNSSSSWWIARHFAETVTIASIRLIWQYQQDTGTITMACCKHVAFQPKHAKPSNLNAILFKSKNGFTSSTFLHGQDFKDKNTTRNLDLIVVGSHNIVTKLLELKVLQRSRVGFDDSFPFESRSLFCIMV